MEFVPYLDWVDVPDPANPPAGAKQIETSDLLRYEHGLLQAKDELTTRLSDTSLRETITREILNPSSAPFAFFRTEYGVSIAAYGAVGDGVTDDTKAIQSALNESNRVFIPEPAVAYRITGRLIPKTGQTIRGLGKRSTIRQDIWGEPVFDGLNRSDLTVEDLHCLSTQARTWSTTGARGDAAQAIGAGVWSNGDRLSVRNLWVTGLYCGVTLSSWNGADLLSKKQTGVRIDGLTLDAVDFGILAKGQLNFRANNVCGSFTFATPTTATPPPYPHLIYFSSEGYESEDVVVTNASAWNGSSATNAYAFQFKGVSGGSASNLSAKSCRGLLALFGVKDMRLSQLTSINDLSDGQGAIYMGDIGNKRLTISDVGIEMAADVRAIRIDGEDGRYSNICTFTTRETSNPGTPDISVYGNRNTLENVTDINKGSGGATGILVHAGAGHRVVRPKLRNVFRGVFVDSAATGTIVEYDPADMTPSAVSGGNYRSATVGAGGTLLTRPDRVATSSGNGGTIQPEPSSCGVLIHTTTGSSTMTVGNPRVEGRSLGLQLTVTIANASTSAAGGITWQGDYAFAGAAPASPAAKARVSITFMWDGLAWREVSRST